MRYMDVREASEKWGISDRRIRVLCNEGRIDGAIKLNWSWTIPENAPKPRDGRVLRKFRNLDIRPGNADIGAIAALSEKTPISSDLKSNPAILSVIADSLEFLLLEADTAISKEAINKVLSGKIDETLSLKDHLLIINFKSILFSLIEKKERWFERDLREIYVRLMQGIDDISSSKYRDGFARATPRSDDEVRVDVQMETLLNQYEMSWKNLSSLISGTLLYGEIVRIKPYEQYSELLAYLVLAGEFMRENILPPCFSAANLEESRAALSLAVRRGNYADFTQFVERAVFASYGVVADV